MLAISEIQIVNHRLDPTETILHVLVDHGTNVPNECQVRGRLNGPRCPFSTTIEIAYPLRERARGDDIVTMGTVIPEPSWWDPESPFVYAGFVEMWYDDVGVGRADFQHAIYWLQMTSKGLRLNGLPFVLRGKCVEQIGDIESLRFLRDRGFNWLIACDPPSIEDRNLAVRYGFFVSHEPAFTEQSIEAIDHDLDILQQSAKQNRRAANDAQAAWFTSENPLRVVHGSEVARTDQFKLVASDGIPTNLPSDRSIIGWIET